MSNAKQKNTASQSKKASVASKLASMVAASSQEENQVAEGMVDDSLSMTQLISELAKQREVLKEDMASLILNSVKPLQTSVDALHNMVNSFQSRLTSPEVIVGENFERLVAAESIINSLKAQNSLLMERLDDLENRSRRSNLRILNIPEGSEDGKDPTIFVSEMLAEIMPEVFANPPPKPAAGKPARAFVLCFHRYRDRELTLRWAGQHEVKFKGFTVRVYPDLSNALAKKRAAFNPVKQALYKERIRFTLLYPARLKVTFKEESFIFETPKDANDFYEKQVLTWKEK
ncbi:hypothetical protein QQF64_035931 [Cirrhinus molitorella]|uniref:Uncharacterized protein n=1 Tax=Cirrhinus molitorella TaxID=172907 RepID=A0ABR3NHY4_9TELE